MTFQDSRLVTGIRSLISYINSVATWNFFKIRIAMAWWLVSIPLRHLTNEWNHLCGGIFYLATKQKWQNALFAQWHPGWGRENLSPFFYSVRTKNNLSWAALAERKCLCWVILAWEISERYCRGVAQNLHPSSISCRENPVWRNGHRIKTRAKSEQQER